MSKNTGAGKGDAPRNCFSKQFKDNYDAIDWSKDEEFDYKCECGSLEEPYFSRTEPMGYFCTDCGEETKLKK